MSTASTATATRAVEAPARASWLRRLATSRELGIFLALALVVIATTVRNPAFVFSPDGFRDLLLTPSILVVVAVGQAVVIISRNVDLSVGSILGLSAYLTGTPNQLREYVKDGTVTEFALWNPEDLGYLAAYAADSLVKGDITGASGDQFTAGKLNDFTVGENNTVLLGDPYRFNADNIDDFDF